MRFRSQEQIEAPKLQMTPMIDVVFQLMIFFVCTFRIVRPEGDLSLSPQHAAAGRRSDDLNPVPESLKVRLLADAQRELAAIEFSSIEIQGAHAFEELQKAVRVLVDDAARTGSPLLDVEIANDYGLKYKYVLQAMAALQSDVDPTTGESRVLIENVRLSPLNGGN